jgi:hypothetical protein
LPWQRRSRLQRPAWPGSRSGRLGRRLAAEFQRYNRPLEIPGALAYINGIGQRLAAQIGGPPFTYSFALVADDPTMLHDVAAFPGGFVFVPASPILAV